jgi:uncharacterized YigZ family protein
MEVDQIVKRREICYTGARSTSGSVYVPERYPVPAGTARIEFVEKCSRFIGTAGPAPSVEDALAFIRQVAGEFADASHNAWAYLVGFGPAAVYACHNDGEPGGTAGPPALAALQSSGLGDIVVVVTRYFGGVKLGTGGLVRAYGRAAREAAAALPRTEKVARARLRLELDYHFHDAARRLFDLHEVQVAATEYAERARFELSVPLDRLDGFLAAIRELTAGAAKIERI